MSFTPPFIQKPYAIDEVSAPANYNVAGAGIVYMGGPTIVGPDQIVIVWSKTWGGGTLRTGAGTWEDIDLAHKGTVTRTTALSITNPGDELDGDDDTAEIVAIPASTTAAVEIESLDLGDIYDFMVKFRYKATSTSITIYIDGSEDGSTWNNIATITPGLAGTIYGKKYGAINTRYVRIRATNSATTSQSVYIYSFECLRTLQSGMYKIYRGPFTTKKFYIVNGYGTGYCETGLIVITKINGVSI